MIARLVAISRRALLVVLAIAVPSATADAVAAHGPDPALSGGLFGQNQALEFRWRSGSEPAGAVRNAILAAAAANSSSRASKSATFAYDSTAPNLIGYGTGTCGANGLACFTRTAPTGFTMWLREHGRVFDWGTLRWCQMQASPTNGCYDAQTIALDEFGHIQILDHHVNYSDGRDYTEAVVQTFSRTRPAAGWNMHTYGTCDTATLQIKYDVTTLSSLYSKCLDVVTVLSLAADDTSVGYGASIDFSSVLKVATNTSLGRLSANPIGARTIRIQRRAIGSSTWANVATLASTSPTGTYVGSIYVYTTADYRSVFSTPTNEGLHGDASPTVRVTVTCPLNCPEP